MHHLSKFCPEAGLLLNACRSLLSRMPLSDRHDGAFDLSWGKVVDIAARHKLLPLLASQLSESSLRQKAFTSHMSGVLCDAMTSAACRSEEAMKVAVAIQRILAEIEIPSISRKGLVYDAVLYGGKKLRTINDIDFYIPRAKADRACEELQRHGFHFRKYDSITGKWKELDRADYLSFKLYPDHVPTLTKLLDNPFLPCIMVDFAFDMSWYGSGFQEVVDSFLDDALASLVREESTNLLTASLPFHFIDCALHLFRESYFENNIKGGPYHGVTLQKFLDLSLLWASLSEADRQWLSSRINSTSIAEPIAYSAQHTDTIFDTDMVEGLGLEKWLLGDIGNTWKKANGKVGRWNGSMLDRLFTTDFLSIFPDLRQE